MQRDAQAGDAARLFEDRGQGFDAAGGGVAAEVDADDAKRLELAGECEDVAGLVEGVAAVDLFLSVAMLVR